MEVKQKEEVKETTSIKYVHIGKIGSGISLCGQIPKRRMPCHKSEAFKKATCPECIFKLKGM